MRRALKALVAVVYVTAVAVVIVSMVVPALLGMQRYVITGGSMTGTIAKGSVIYCDLTPTERLRAGDIITFRPPGQAAVLTHRIIEIAPGQDGRSVYRTKGDFNEAADPWSVNLVEPTQARYVFHIPYVGYVLAALTIREVRVVLIGLPALVIAMSLLWSLWRQAGQELARREGEADSDDAGSEA